MLFVLFVQRQAANSSVFIFMVSFNVFEMKPLEFAFKNVTNIMVFLQSAVCRLGLYFLYRATLCKFLLPQSSPLLAFLLMPRTDNLYFENLQKNLKVMFFLETKNFSQSSPLLAFPLMPQTDNL